MIGCGCIAFPVGIAFRVAMADENDSFGTHRFSFSQSRSSGFGHKFP
jgi:hypothetical protein